MSSSFLGIKFLPKVTIGLASSIITFKLLITSAIALTILPTSV